MKRDDYELLIRTLQRWRSKATGELQRRIQAALVQAMEESLAAMSEGDENE